MIKTVVSVWCLLIDVYNAFLGVYIFFSTSFLLLAKRKKRKKIQFHYIIGDKVLFIPYHVSMLI